MTGHKKPLSRGRTFNAEWCLSWANRGRTFNASLRVWGLFYSWPVAPQQSRLRFKQLPKLGSFSLLFFTVLPRAVGINLGAHGVVSRGDDIPLPSTRPGTTCSPNNPSASSADCCTERTKPAERQKAVSSASTHIFRWLLRGSIQERTACGPPTCTAFFAKTSFRARPYLGVVKRQKPV